MTIDINIVAPNIGAWIEIKSICNHSIKSSVAPNIGAWIEIYIFFWHFNWYAVAPNIGAWIEIYHVLSSSYAS